MKKHLIILLITVGLLAFAIYYLIKTDYVKSKTITNTTYVNLEEHVKVTKLNSNRWFSIITIDKCEYVLYSSDNADFSRAGLTHKGNCKNH